MVTLLLGILSSVFTEVITALNHKLQNTVLKGKAAFLLSFTVAMVLALIKTFTAPDFSWSILHNWTQLVATFTSIFGISQVYFLLVVKNLNLDVSAPSSGPLKFTEGSTNE